MFRWWRGAAAVTAVLMLWGGAQACSTTVVDGAVDGSGGSAGAASGNYCPADHHVYAAPDGSCTREGKSCSYGDTSCINVYVCQDGSWKNQGCPAMTSTSESSGTN